MTMQQFWKLLEKSVIFTGLISLIVIGGAVYAALAMIPLPDWYTIALSIVLGFFFGQKAGTNASKQE